jgi:hypothetical protein
MANTIITTMKQADQQQLHHEKDLVESGKKMGESYIAYMKETLANIKAQTRHLKYTFNTWANLKGTELTLTLQKEEERKFGQVLGDIVKEYNTKDI